MRHQDRCDLYRAQPSLVVGHGRHLYLIQRRQFRKVVGQPRPVRRIERKQDDRTARHAAHLIVGDFRETLPAFAARHAGRIALVHADIGSGDEAATAALARWLGPAMAPLLRPGAIVLADQKMVIGGSRPQDLPPGVPQNRYFIYRRA